MTYFSPYADLKRTEIEIERLSGLLEHFSCSIRCVVYQQHNREVERLLERIQQCRRPLLKIRYLEMLNNTLEKIEVRADCTEEFTGCTECQTINQIRQKILQILLQSSTALLEQVVW